MSALLVFLYLLSIQTNAARETSVLTKISEDPDLTYFNDLLETSGAWKNSLFYSKVTIFAPTNKAFRSFNGRITQNLTSYHIVYSNFHTDDLIDGNLESINQELPPLWLTRKDDQIFVNNALVIKGKSDFAARNSKYGKHQILHFIDQVLDPVVNGNTKPTAHDFLSRTKIFTDAHKCRKFFSKVIQYHEEALFKNQGGFTFFIPVDSGIDEFRLNSIDSYIIKSHIINHRVVFLRPAQKNHYYNTSADDDDYVNIFVAIDESETNSYTVKSNTILGDSNHRTGVIKADILMGNIPVKNGVVHLISRPLGVFDQKLTMFPFVEVKDKFAMDPYLNISYSLGSRSGFNSYLKSKKKFTFFVPRDAAWRNLTQWFDINILLKPSFVDFTRNLMSRHLIVGDVPYLMETLVDASKDGCMQVMTPQGKTCLAAYNREGKYFIKWNETYIDVYRPNFQCSDGIVHILDKPFISNDDIRFIPKKSISNFQLWGAILNILFTKND